MEKNNGQDNQIQYNDTTYVITFFSIEQNNDKKWLED